MKYEEVFELISSDLEEVEREIQENIKSPVPLVNKISRHLLGSGGKRLRPSVLLLSSGACGSLNGRKRIKSAAAIELIHTATLLHDDVVDEAKMRRGKASSNVLWQNKPTVLVGDFMLSKALGLIQSCENMNLIKAVTDASAKLAEGQVLEVMSESRMIDVSEEICFSIIEMKTASLIESCSKIGGILAESDNSSIDALSSYGINIGIAFQLIDDAFDYSSSEEVCGKQVGQDIIGHKMTLPLYYSMQKATTPEKNKVKEVLTKNDADESEINELRNLVKKYKGAETTKELAIKYVEKAKSSINSLSASKYKNSLNSLADFVVNRVN